MTNKPHFTKSDIYLATEITDNADRRSGIDRRQFKYDGHIPERRQQPGRRTVIDRRSGLDRRSHTDRRKGKLREKDQKNGRLLKKQSNGELVYWEIFFCKPNSGDEPIFLDAGHILSFHKFKYSWYHLTYTKGVIKWRNISNIARMSRDKMFVVLLEG